MKRTLRVAGCWSGACSGDTDETVTESAMTHREWFHRCCENLENLDRTTQPHMYMYGMWLRHKKAAQMVYNQWRIWDIATCTASSARIPDPGNVAQHQTFMCHAGQLSVQSRFVCCAVHGSSRACYQFLSHDRIPHAVSHSL